jgi:hypothetical protein
MEATRFSSTHVRLAGAGLYFADCSSPPSIILSTGAHLYFGKSDNICMGKEKDNPIKHRCAWVMKCYLAEELRCFGFKIDCPLYRQSNGDSFDQEGFDKAMDELIDQTRAKHSEREDA